MLPLGWKVARDPTSGKFYYFHTDGTVQWEPPTGFPPRRQGSLGMPGSARRVELSAPPFRGAVPQTPPSPAPSAPGDGSGGDMQLRSTPTPSVASSERSRFRSASSTRALRNVEDFYYIGKWPPRCLSRCTPDSRTC
jgi:hypothetical protein